MNIPCAIIQDLLPLYTEDLLSDESKGLVEEHLHQCPACQKELLLLKTTAPFPEDRSAVPLQKIQQRIQAGKMKTGLLFAAIALLFALLLMLRLTAPHYLDYSPSQLRFVEADGKVVAVLGEEVTGYELSRGPGGEYTMTLWNSFWDQRVLHRQAGEVLLNPSGEKVEVVYYSSASGFPDRLVYGQPLHGEEGRITLPRLALNYYLLLAGGLLLVLGAMALIRRRSPGWRRLALVPLAYILSHFLVLGGSSSTYAILRDFSGILLVMIPVYGVLWSLDHRFFALKSPRGKETEPKIKS